MRRVAGIFGTVLLAAGILMFAAGSLGFVATVVLDTTPPDITYWYPNGTEGSPNPMLTNSAITLKAVVNARDPATTVKCQITYPSGSSLTVYLNCKGVELEDQIWEASWTPTSDGQYKFVFSATDQAGNTATKTGWAKASTETPQMVWYFNGMQVADNGTIVVATREVNVKGVLTRAASSTTSVWVKVQKGSWAKTIYLSKETSTDWTGTMVLDQGDGSYTVTGHCTTSGKEYQTMLATVGLGGLSPRPVELSAWQIVSLGLMVLGLALVAVSIGAGVRR